MALTVVPHAARGRADGRLLPLLRVTLAHRAQQSGTVRPPRIVAHRVPLAPSPPVTINSVHHPRSMQISKVYAVIGGFDYEGEDFKSLRLFDCFSTAVEYMHHLEEVEGFDYSVMDTREVSMESALACAA